MHSPSNDGEDGHHELKKHLGALNLTAIGIGAIIGAGIFVITGQAAADFAGPAITLSFVIAAIICIFAGLCYAELSSMIPVSGGSYSYAYIALGELPAWIVGWMLTSQLLFSSATVAVGWSGYCMNLLKDFGFQLPYSLSSAPILYTPELGLHWSGAFINLPAVILIGVVGIFITIGIKAAATFNNIMVVIKLCTVALFIILGIAYVNTDNWHPFIPENTGVFGQYGWSGILRGAGLVFFAYIGFDTVATMAQESKNPQKDLPRGILGSLAICTVAYVITALILTGVISYKFLSVPDPMSVALDAMGSQMIWLKYIVKLAIIAGLASVALVQLLALTRIFMTISKDGLLPRAFSKVHTKTKTPVFSSILTAIACMAAAGLFPIAVLGSLVVMSTLIIFAIVCLGVLILRYTHPEFERPFKVPLVPIIPAVGILCCVAQMGFLPIDTWAQLIVWLAIGLTVYFQYSRHHSNLRLPR
ncbi:MAG: amino acid/polyamine/organocation transporter, superfamily [Parachlamydiales bacterium]|nr:amino acid/polyamine/organocation transporter, superfamily [Parachlamydiales bacterium]